MSFVWYLLFDANSSDFNYEYDEAPFKNTFSWSLENIQYSFCFSYQAILSWRYVPSQSLNNWNFAHFIRESFREKTANRPNAIVPEEVIEKFLCLEWHIDREIINYFLIFKYVSWESIVERLKKAKNKTHFINICIAEAYCYERCIPWNNALEGIFDDLMTNSKYQQKVFSFSEIWDFISAFIKKSADSSSGFVQKVIY